MNALAVLRVASVLLGIAIQVAELAVIAKQLRTPSQADEARES